MALVFNIMGCAEVLEILFSLLPVKEFGVFQSFSSIQRLMTLFFNDWLRSIASLFSLLSAWFLLLA